MDAQTPAVLSSKHLRQLPQATRLQLLALEKELVQLGEGAVPDGVGAEQRNRQLVELAEEELQRTARVVPQGRGYRMNLVEVCGLGPKADTDPAPGQPVTQLEIFVAPAATEGLIEQSHLVEPAA